jgi:hypothetical protein
LVTSMHPSKPMGQSAHSWQRLVEPGNDAAAHIILDAVLEMVPRDPRVRLPQRRLDLGYSPSQRLHPFVTSC